MNTLDKQYLDLLQDILDNGTRKEDRTGVGTISVYGRQLRHKMSDGFPLLTTKKMYWNCIVTELLWFLQGRTDLRFLLENDCHIWTGDAYQVYDKDFDREHPAFSAPYPKRLTVKEFEEKIMTDDEFNKWYGDLGPIYGKQWRDWGSKKEYGQGESVMYGGIDQIANSLNLLKTDPDSRRLMVTAWNPSEIDQMTLPPCHTDFQFYTREMSFEDRRQMYNSNLLDEYGETKSHDELTINDLDKLNIPTRAISLMWNQRSVDTFLGLPFNIASYGLLLHIIAEIVNMVPDELICGLGDTHIYTNHIDAVQEQLTREPYPLPSLNINTEWWPTESGECGIGHISVDGFLSGLDNNVQHFVRCLMEEDIQLGNYKYHPSIKGKLNN